jgi:hypothetical protein
LFHVLSLAKTGCPVHRSCGRGNSARACR